MSLGGGVITTILSSPLQHRLRTVQLAFPPEATDKRLVVKEKLRERLGVYTCDQKSSKSWIAKNHPSFDIKDHFQEDDILWSPDRRETLEEHFVRSKELLDRQGGGR